MSNKKRMQYQVLPADNSATVSEVLKNDISVSQIYRQFNIAFDEARIIGLIAHFDFVELFWMFYKASISGAKSYLEISKLDSVSMYIMAKALPVGSFIGYFLGSVKSKERAEKVMTQLTAQGYITTLYNTSVEIDYSFDIAFVDGERGYTDVKNDIETAKKHMSPNESSMIILHDTTIQKFEKTVKLYADVEIRKKFSGEEFDNNWSNRYGTMLFYPNVTGEVSTIQVFKEYEQLIDLVIPLTTGQGHSVWDNNELRYCIRSFEKNFPNLGNIFVVTDKLPDWLKNVVHVPCADIYTVCKDSIIINKVITACGHGKMAKRFIFSADDNIVLNTTKEEDYTPKHVYDIEPRQDADFPDSWHKSLKEVRINMSKSGFGSVNFESHTPAIFNKMLFMGVMAMFPYREKRCGTIYSMYFNPLGYNMNNTQSHGTVVVNICEKGDVAKIGKEKIMKKIFLNYKENGLSDDFKQFLSELFPEKSSFEK